jgi:hypothetical protein
MVMVVETLKPLPWDFRIPTTLPVLIGASQE